MLPQLRSLAAFHRGTSPHGAAGIASVDFPSRPAMNPPVQVGRAPCSMSLACQTTATSRFAERTNLELCYPPDRVFPALHASSHAACRHTAAAFLHAPASSATDYWPQANDRRKAS